MKFLSEDFGKGFNTGVVIYDLEKIRKSLDFAVGIHFIITRRILLTVWKGCKRSWAKSLTMKFYMWRGTSF
jgi:hypothetical protein